MRRGLLCFAVCVACAAVGGCGGSSPAKAGAARPSSPIAAAPDRQDTMEGVDLRLFDARPSSGAARKPTFWVHADVFSLAEEKIWSFEKARAVIYGREEDKPEITLEAGRGRFQESKMAYLKDGVDVRIGDMRLTLTDMVWLNDDRVGQSDNPLTITTEHMHLQASSVRMYPDRRQLVLTRVTGILPLGGETP